MARRSSSRNAISKASTSFEYYRNKNMSSADGSDASGVDEPSTANDGNAVLYTGNWFAALSTDSGNSFSYINPYTLGPTPTLPQGGFCCDQVAIHSPNSSYDVTAWGLLYCNSINCNTGDGDNILRLAVAPNQSDLASGTFNFYDMSAQTFGFAAGWSLDYPHFEANSDYLFMSINVFNGNTFEDDLMVRFDLSALASGGSATYGYYYNNQDFTWTPTDNSTDTWGYWGATAVREQLSHPRVQLASRSAVHKHQLDGLQCQLQLRMEGRSLHGS